MVVIDWLQTSEFIRQNSERFVLYCLCGCFMGIAIILLTIIIVLYIEKRHKTNTKNPEEIKTDYQSPRIDLEYNEILSGTRSYLPVYHYNGRTHTGTYHL